LEEEFVVVRASVNAFLRAGKAVQVQLAPEAAPHSLALEVAWHDVGQEPGLVVDAEGPTVRQPRHHIRETFPFSVFEQNVQLVREQ